MQRNYEFVIYSQFGLLYIQYITTSIDAGSVAGNVAGIRTGSPSVQLTVAWALSRDD